MDMISFFLYTFISLTAIVSPLMVIVIFIPLTRGMSVDDRRVIAKKSVLLAGLVALFFALTGTMILDMLGIRIDSLRVAGGILLFKIAFDMIFARMSRESVTEKEVESSLDKDDIWVSPLAIPMITGPATITTVILLVGSAPSVLYKVIVIISIILTYITCYIALYFSRKIYDRIGFTGSLVATRLMGMFLAALAVEFVTNGVWNIYMSFS